MALDEENTSSTKLVYNPSKVYFGKESANLQLSVDSEKVIFDTLYSSVNQTGFKFDRNGNMTIDFTSLIQQGINNINTGNAARDAAFKAFLQASDTNIKIKIVGNAVTDNSIIKVQASKD